MPREQARGREGAYEETQDRMSVPLATNISDHDVNEHMLLWFSLIVGLAANTRDINNFRGSQPSHGRTHIHTHISGSELIQR